MLEKDRFGREMEFQGTPMTRIRLSLIIPTLNEGASIGATLSKIAPLRADGVEVIVVDGGSTDDTVEQAAGAADQVLRAARGRALQMNAGAAAANGEVLLFLHADTTLPEQAVGAVEAGLAGGARQWGRFDVRLSGSRPLLRVIGLLMNLRSRWTGIATGDQAIFMTREAFRRVGGFPAIALMEDIAMSRKLKCLGAPLCLRQRVITSSRRWERDGIMRTVLRMWYLRLAYALGRDPARLARHYRHG